MMLSGQSRGRIEQWNDSGVLERIQVSRTWSGSILMHLRNNPRGWRQNNRNGIPFRVLRLTDFKVGYDACEENENEVKRNMTSRALPKETNGATLADGD